MMLLFNKFYEVEGHLSYSFEALGPFEVMVPVYRKELQHNGFSQNEMLKPNHQTSGPKVMILTYSPFHTHTVKANIFFLKLQSICKSSNKCSLGSKSKLLQHLNLGEFLENIVISSHNKSFPMRKKKKKKGTTTPKHRKNKI